MLTAAGIRTLRPTEQAAGDPRPRLTGRVASDRPAVGVKSWALRFRRPDGAHAKLTLGPVDLAAEADGELQVGIPLTLAGARRLAADINRDRAMGRDISATRRRRGRSERFRTRSGRPTRFRQCAADFVERHAKVEDSRGQGDREVAWPHAGRRASSREDCATSGARRPLSEITAHDIHHIIEDARTRGVPGMGVKGDGPSEARARHLFSALSVMFTWAVQHGESMWTRRRVSTARVPAPRGTGCCPIRRSSRSGTRRRPRPTSVRC